MGGITSAASITHYPPGRGAAVTPCDRFSSPATIPSDNLLFVPHPQSSNRHNNVYLIDGFKLISFYKTVRNLCLRPWLFFVLWSKVVSPVKKIQQELFDRNQLTKLAPCLVKLFISLVYQHMLQCMAQLVSLGYFQWSFIQFLFIWCRILKCFARNTFKDLLNTDQGNKL